MAEIRRYPRVAPAFGARIGAGRYGRADQWDADAEPTVLRVHSSRAIVVNTTAFDRWQVAGR
jgi:hypothetical protein